MVCLPNDSPCPGSHRRTSRRSASSTYATGTPFVGGPCGEGGCRRMPHHHLTDRPLAPAKPRHEAAWSGSAFDLPHLLVIDLRLQHLECPLDHGAPTGNLIRCRRIAHRMSDRHAAKDSIGSCLQGDRRERSNERGRDASPFHFPGQRCPAPCSGPSRAREHDGVDARLAQFVRYLTSHSHGHRHRGVIARRHVEVIM